ERPLPSLTATLTVIRSTLTLTTSSSWACADSGEKAVRIVIKRKVLLQLVRAEFLNGKLKRKGGIIKASVIHRLEWLFCRKNEMRGQVSLDIHALPPF